MDVDESRVAARVCHCHDFPHNILHKNTLLIDTKYKKNKEEREKKRYFGFRDIG